jgi:hypothetical protein
LIIIPTYYHSTTTVFCIFNTKALPHRGTSYHCGATVNFWRGFNIPLPIWYLPQRRCGNFFGFLQTKPLPHLGTFFVFFGSAVVKTEQKKEKTELFFFFYTQKIPRKKFKKKFFGEEMENSKQKRQQLN